MCDPNAYHSFDEITRHERLLVFQYFIADDFYESNFSDQGQGVVLGITEIVARENVKFISQFCSNNTFSFLNNFLEKNKGRLLFNDSAANSLSPQLNILLIQTINVPGYVAKEFGLTSRSFTCARR